MKNASDMLPSRDWSEFSGVVSGKSQTSGWVSDVERFIEETRSYETDFDCSEDHAVAVNLNVAMDALAEIVERYKANENAQPPGA